MESSLSPETYNRPSRATTWGLVLILTILGVGVCFINLGGPKMEPDEAFYALAVDHIRATGDWLTLYPHPPDPYFNKPPLYMWLSAITYDVLPGFETKYRFWSALFGVVTIVLTGLLGLRVFSPAVGLIAGCLLATNRSFLFEHGARFGGMDAGLAACFAGMLLIDFASTAGMRMKAWIGIGVLAGVACLFKPLAGLPMLAFIAGHIFWTRRHHFPGLFAAAIAAGVVALPWYAYEAHLFGNTFTSQVFTHQLAKRMWEGGQLGENQPWFYYLVRLPRAASFFILLWPGVLWLAWQARDASNRRGLRRFLLLVIALGTIGLSVSAGKFLHYAYPLFPVMCVTLAGMLVAITDAITHGFRFQTQSIGRRMLAAGMVGYALFVAIVRGPAVGEPLNVWSLYQSAMPEMVRKNGNLFFVDVPHAPEIWPDQRVIHPEQMIYLSHMSGEHLAGDLHDVADRVAAGRAVVLFVNSSADAARFSLIANATIGPRYVIDQSAYSVYAWNFPALRSKPFATINPKDLNHPSLKWLTPGTFERTLAVELHATGSEAVRLSFKLRLPTAMPPRLVRCIIHGAGEDAAERLPWRFDGTHMVGVTVDRFDIRRSPIRKIELTFLSADGDPAPIRLECVEVTLEAMPSLE